VASGCILGKCICGEFVWEDEHYDIVNGRFIHNECVGKYCPHCGKSLIEEVEG
jgi:hypothetical protein